MLNYETILSSFNDKMTLMQWLKKVEEALKDASATAFDVTRLDNERVKFSLTFANGEKLETSVLIAIKGEKGDTGTSVVRFYIDNGHLFVELDNGITQDLGLLFSGNINVDGTISCTSINATGEVDGHKVTGDEIVEKMQGYAYLPRTKENITITPIYASCVKNGNKVTFVQFLELTRTGDVENNNAILGAFAIPSSIGAKLYPYNLTLSNVLDSKFVQAFSSFTSKLDIPTLCVKLNDAQIYSMAFNLQNMALNTKYMFRYEVTFLLSNNWRCNYLPCYTIT